MIRVLDLFSGIGGFSLGLESTGHYETIGFCEIEPFCREVLAHHWPGVPIWEDVRELTAESLGGLRPDAIVGGFPCQDISGAGKGAGLDGARSGLWSEFARLVGELRPAWVLAENVGALRTRGIDRVCSDLESSSYTVWPLVVGAWAVGAPHRRDRVWIVAHRARDGQRGEHEAEWAHGERAGPGGHERMAHRDGAGQGSQRGRWLLDGEREAPGNDVDGRGERVIPCWPARPGEPQHEWEEPRLVVTPGKRLEGSRPGTVRESERETPRGGRPSNTGAGRAQLAVGGAAYGVSQGLVEALSARRGMACAQLEEWWERNQFKVERRWNREALKALGNAVVPQVVAALGEAIYVEDQKLVRA